MKNLNKKSWLVYLILPCEMGTEGWSSWTYYSVAFGNTDEEIYKSWVENVKKLYDVDLSNDLKCKNNKWYCHYYELCKNELPRSVYGDAQSIFIEKRFREHMDL